MNFWYQSKYFSLDIHAENIFFNSYYGLSNKLTELKIGRIATEITLSLFSAMLALLDEDKTELLRIPPYKFFNLNIFFYLNGTIGWFSSSFLPRSTQCLWIIIEQHIKTLSKCRHIVHFSGNWFRYLNHSSSECASIPDNIKEINGVWQRRPSKIAVLRYQIFHHHVSNCRSLLLETDIHGLILHRYSYSFLWIFLHTIMHIQCFAKNV